MCWLTRTDAGVN